MSNVVTNGGTWASVNANTPTVSISSVQISDSITLNSLDRQVSINLPVDGESMILTFKGHPLITIHRNGKVDKHPSFTTDDEASLKFWEALMDTFDIAWWKGLVKRR